jgi:hypothetical protein
MPAKGSGYLNYFNSTPICFKIVESRSPLQVNGFFILQEDAE